MRTYALITPPAAVLDHLRAAIDEVAPSVGDLPWMHPDGWNCRVAGFGNLGLEDTTLVMNTLEKIGTYCPPLMLQLAGAEARPADDSAEELAVGVQGDVQGLKSLAGAIPSMVQPQGLFLDRRNFRSVVTVAQGAREPFSATSALAALGGYLGPEWTATEMRLVRLVPGRVDDPAGGHYEDMVRYQFSAPPEPVEATTYAGASAER
jgi:2'-5' RNA ligase